MKVLYITLGVGAVLIISAILFDVFARDQLFTYSLEVIKKFQSQFKGSLFFFKFLSVLCSEYVLLPLGILIYLVLPLNKAFAFMTVLALSNYFDNILKIIYGNPRPFWVDNGLFLTCDGGFGNPSGHSFVSTASYLSIAHILIGMNTIKHTIYRIALNIFILLFFILVIISIIISRIYLGVHSINQVIYGSFLGAITYYLCYFALTTHNNTPKEFYSSFNNKRSIITYLGVYTLGILIALLLYFLIDNKPEPAWVNTLIQYCPKVYEYRKFNNDGLFACFQLFFLFGIHSGMVLAFRMLNKNKDKGNELITRIVYWNKGTLIKRGYKALLVIPFMLILLLFIIVPSDTFLPVIFIFKIALPFYLAGFLVFGPYLLLLSRLKLLPQEEEIIEEIDINGKSEELTHSNDIDKVSINTNNNSN